MTTIWSPDADRAGTNVVRVLTTVGPDEVALQGESKKEAKARHARELEALQRRQAEDARLADERDAKARADAIAVAKAEAEDEERRLVGVWQRKLNYGEQY